MSKPQNLIDFVMEPAMKATNPVDRARGLVVGALLMPFVVLPGALQALAGNPPAGTTGSPETEYDHAHVAFKRD